jgi:tRNA-dihydrouridine synthase
MFTEFTSADGLIFADEKGQKRLDTKLSFTPTERPIVAQLFTVSPERMERAARIVAERGFDGLDINMGCPAKAVEKSGCGAAMIKNPSWAKEIIRAAKRGARGLPISVKTRIGYRTNELDTWIPALLGENIAALTIHARTRNEMSDVPAQWDTIAQAVQVRNAIQNPRGDASWMTLIIGNGDVRDIADARAKVAESGCDGVMLGRAVFGNPWLISEKRRFSEVSHEMRVSALIEHIALFQEKLSGLVNEAVMKRHFKAYIQGWHGAADLRARLMETNDLDAATVILKQQLQNDILSP